jgi:hypothetical protein
MWILDIQPRKYKKTKDNRDEIHEIYSRIEFIRPYKNENILE